MNRLPSPQQSRARIGQGGKAPCLPKWSNLYLAMTLLSASAWLHAQDFGPPVPPGGESRPPAFLKPDQASPLLTAPAPEQAPEGKTATAGKTTRILVREIRVTGNTVFSDQELAQVTAPYVGREVTAEDLAALRQALTLKYVKAGYINSGALLPDQKVADGVIEYRIVEGRLTDITVTGAKRLHPDYVSDRLALGGGPPLNVNALQDRLQILLQGPFIERINAELSPGDRPGEARLNAKVEEGPRGNLSFTLDNDLSPSLGAVRSVLQGQWYSPSGRGDILSGDLEYAQGYSKFSADYGIPLSASDTTLDILAETSDAKVVEDPLNALDIQSHESTLGLRLNHPVLHTANEQLSLAEGFDLRQSKSQLLGTGFAFTPGVEPDGKSQVSVFRFIQDYVARDRSQVIAARSTISWGVDAFGATNQGDDVPNGKFLAWLAQFQYAHRLGKSDSQLVFRFDGQLTSKPLLPLEQFSVGGMRTVRGYRTNELVRDQGYASSLELRVPVVRSEDGAPLLQLAPFVDVGGAWYKDRATEEPHTLSSAGLGLRYDPRPGVHAELYWADAFQDVTNPSNSLQDRGWNLMFRADL
ncbi:MAG: ShlB/FhaC/HecB family hemolysin secretion/activation protein [Gallionellaceae bacterium]